MNSTGAKIKKLRMCANLTQAELAEKIGCTPKSIQRYESDRCYPETHNLQKISEFFGVPADFLLESDTTITQRRRASGEGVHRWYYERYLRCKNTYQIDSGAEYYWIYLEDDGTFGGQSQWVDWADTDRRIEVRKLRRVIPESAIRVCTDVYGPPMIINNELEVGLFCVFGGHAIIKTDICKKYLPEFYEDYTGPSPELKNAQYAFQAEIIPRSQEKSARRQDFLLFAPDKL
ncbi:MAG: helix-turn-helix domain-containing protein [Oscillospiraceae bacterium]|nr:helix-turn-helix domain-containing protein [Oscillospiraceae bacterium]